MVICIPKQNRDYTGKTLGQKMETKRYCTIWKVSKDTSESRSPSLAKTVEYTKYCQRMCKCTAGHSLNQNPSFTSQLGHKSQQDNFTDNNLPSLPLPFTTYNTTREKHPQPSKTHKKNQTHIHHSPVVGHKETRTKVGCLLSCTFLPLLPLFLFINSMLVSLVLLYLEVRRASTFVSKDCQHNAPARVDASLMCEQNNSNWVMGSIQQTTYVTGHKQPPKGQTLSFSSRK